MMMKERSGCRNCSVTYSKLVEFKLHRFASNCFLVRYRNRKDPIMEEGGDHGNFSTVNNKPVEFSNNSSIINGQEAKRGEIDRQQSIVSSPSGQKQNYENINFYNSVSQYGQNGENNGEKEQTPTRKICWDEIKNANGSSTPLSVHAGRTVRDSAALNRVMSSTNMPKNDFKYMNVRFLPKEADTYRLETFNKNRMIIFNQVSIPGYRPRHGTMKDVEALKNCFERRGFEVESFDDCTKDQLHTIMEQEMTVDLSHYGCFAVVVLTHGSDDGKLLTKDHPVYETEIIEYLKASTTPSLITKPRLLIVQACRGDQVSAAVSAGEFYSSVSRDSVKEDKPYKMANETDLLLLHSAYPGMVSHRGELEGTWFIQSLCHFINESKPDDDILSITRKVIHDVSINYENQVLNKESVLESDKQVPVVTSTLSRKLCLNTDVPGLHATASNIETQIVTEKMVRTRRTSLTMTDSTVVQNMTQEGFVFREEKYGQSIPSNLDMRLKYEAEDFRIRYFNYVRGMLSKFVNRRDAKGDFLKAALPLLHIANTIDCEMVLSKTREETCLQMIQFLQSQDFDDKDMLFFYKYS